MATLQTQTTAPLLDEQVDQFYREGYIVAEQLAPHEVIDRVVGGSGDTQMAEGGRWTPRIFDHDDPMGDRVVHELLVQPRIIGAVEQIFEAPSRVYYGMLAVVPAHGGKGLAWHQDNMYDLVLGRALNVFIACCDITPDKAILWVAPRSHRMGVRDSELVDGHRKAAEPDNGQPLPTMRKGDVCIFDRNLLHHSKTNQTDENRFAYAAQYMELKARRGETGERHDKITPQALARRWAGA